MDPQAAQRVGPNGPLLLQDFHLLDLLAHFDRERIPERVVHAKGAGAYGQFEVTDDISDIVRGFTSYISNLLMPLDYNRHAQGRRQEDRHVRSFLYRRW